MTRRDKGAFRLLVALLAFFVLATWLSTQAKADPETVQDYAFRNATSICALLGQDDSDAGITEVAARLFKAGVEPRQAGEVMYLAVHNVCPAFEDELVAWAHTPSTPAPVYQAAHVGGVIGA
jgi:hypothetical protein